MKPRRILIKIFPEESESGIKLIGYGRGEGRPAPQGRVSEESSASSIGSGQRVGWSGKLLRGVFRCLTP